MATQALAREALGTRDRTPPAIRRAGRVLVVAGAIGLAGQLLFFGHAIGVNFPIAAALTLLGAWRLRGANRIDVLDAWLAPASLAFATFAAVRADETVVALDVVASLALGAAAVASFGGRRVVSRPFGELVALAGTAIGWILTGAIPTLGQARRRMPTGTAVTRHLSPVLPILRGVAIAVPVVLVFVALFAAADAVFADVMGDLLGFEVDLGDAAWRTALALAIAWPVAGGLALASTVPASVAPGSGTQAVPWRAGTTEVATVLIAVIAVFGLFVALQAAYLFGGLDTLAAVGMTYADYARRGFFELVVVAGLAGALIVGAERLARERTRAVVALAIGLALLTGVVLVSAALRLRLYQEAYGWTELRLYVLATIAWLAVGVLALVVALATDRVRWIAHVLGVAALAIGLGLNVIGPVRFITEQNVARVLDPALVPPNGSTGLDETYLVGLGDDAVPALLRALPALEEAPADYLRADLAVRLDRLRDHPALTDWPAWNAGRAEARDVLEAAESQGTLR